VPLRAPQGADAVKYTAAAFRKVFEAIGEIDPAKVFKKK
jgi:hypothetical protein